MQLESTTVMLALKRTTGNMSLVMLAAFHNHLCEQIGGGWIWDKAITLTRAAVWASAAISGPVLNGGARSPIIYAEGGITILAGGVCDGRRW